MKAKRLLILAAAIALTLVVVVVVLLTYSPSNNSLPKTSGAALYAQHCASCHHPLESSTKRGRTATQIETAIAVFAPMNARLHNLTTAEIQDIATALAKP